MLWIVFLIVVFCAAVIVIAELVSDANEADEEE